MWGIRGSGLVRAGFGGGGGRVGGGLAAFMVTRLRCDVNAAMN